MTPSEKNEHKRQILSQAHLLKNAMSRISEVEPSWYTVLLIELATQCTNDCLELARGVDEGHPARCAWGARNLLEMSYFVRFVAQSVENARRFHEDAICDFKDMLKKVEVMLVKDALAPGHAQLAEYMKVMEVVTDTDSFLKVAQIAERFGEKQRYEAANKFLSKFVHPTSVSIQVRKDPVVAAMAIQAMLTLALLFMETTFPPLVKCFESLPVKDGA